MKIVALVFFCLNVVLAAVNTVVAVFGKDSGARLANAAAAFLNLLVAVNSYVNYLR